MHLRSKSSWVRMATILIEACMQGLISAINVLRQKRWSVILHSEKRLISVLNPTLKLAHIELCVFPQTATSSMSCFPIWIPLIMMGLCFENIAYLSQVYILTTCFGQLQKQRDAAVNSQREAEFERAMIEQQLQSMRSGFNFQPVHQSLGDCLSHDLSTEPLILLGSWYTDFTKACAESLTRSSVLMSVCVLSWTFHMHKCHLISSCLRENLLHLCPMRFLPLIEDHIFLGHLY